MKKKKAVLLDNNVFSQEGFTNGIFLTFREFFKRFEKARIDTAILSLSEAETSRIWDGKTFGRNTRIEKGITVEEMIMNGNFSSNKKEFLAAIDKLLNESKPDLIFMYTPAVFFEESHILTLQKALQTKSKVVVLLADELYPTTKNHPGKNVDAYYKLLKQTEVLCTSKNIIKKFKKEVGIEASFFPNIFSPNEVIAKAKEKKRKYITLVNHHPIKGIQIFNEIAKKMPKHNFLVVETWPDVPDYVPPSSNIHFSKFIDDVKTLYAKTKIIIMPSLYEEGPSRLMIEGMLNHIPVIAHDIGSLSEVGKDFAIFIKPPQIKSSDMRGTIIYPKISENEKNDDVDRFVKKIEEIEENKFSQNYGELAYQKALEYCSIVDEKLAILIKKWF
jgi:glycosyltransferase involved in cell wall biosynthesis